MKRYHEICIQTDVSVQDALECMDSVGRKLLIVLEGMHFRSLLSIGDIQRAIIAKVDLCAHVSTIIRDNIKVASTSDEISEIRKYMLQNRNEFMPIVSPSQEIVDVIFWEDLFSAKIEKKQRSLGLPVVIMAGGKGSRLKPITNVLPKPLIPLGEKTIIEEIMQRFIKVGCDDFHLSINYKAEMIKHYFEQLGSNAYKIAYFQEDKPLGTAGSMYLLKGKIKSTFFVSNCDIVIDQDLDEIYSYHRASNNKITIVSALKQYKIPYGTIETLEGGVLKSMEEKPKLTFQINSGMYILEPEVLEEIPDNCFYHITELIEKVQLSGEQVGVFPVNEGSWKDIGIWDEYLKAYGI